MNIKERLKQTEVWFKLLLLILFLYFYFAVSAYPDRSRQFPHLITVSTLILIVISLIIDFTKKAKVEMEIGDADDTELRVLDETKRKVRRKRFYQAWGAILFAVAVGLVGGFLFSTFLLFFGFAIVFGNRKNLLRNTLVGIGMTALTYLVFDYVMQVPLLEGILWRFM